MAVSVVVPNWNSLKHLKRCLDSLAAQSVECELMVVDNGSEDGSVDWLKSHDIPHVSLSENRGFAEAVNIGIAATTEPLVLVLNADAVLDPDCLSRLVSAMTGQREIGGIQPLILQDGAESDTSGGRDPLVYSAGQALTRDGRAYEIGQGEPMPGLVKQRKEVFGVCGAACLLRRQLLSQLHGYDESYFAFYEDVDLNIRARIFGWKFEIEPAAIAWHIGNAVWQAGFRRPAAANARLVARNRLATQIKYVPVGLLPRIVLVECGSLLRALMERRLRATLHGKLEALGRLPGLVEERRQLQRAGNLGAARRWLGDAR